MSQESAIWPQGMPPENITLVLKLFTILDDSSDDSGQRLADEIFTSDGRITNGMHTFSGKAGMSILSYPLVAFARFTQTPGHGFIHSFLKY